MRRRTLAVTAAAVLLALVGAGISEATSTSRTLNKGALAPPGGATYRQASGYPIYSSGPGLATVPITPKVAGALIVLFVELHSRTSPAVTGITSSNIAWNPAPVTVDNVSGVPWHVELWYGTASSTAEATTTISYSRSVSSTPIELIGNEFHASTTGTWALAQGGAVNGSSATVAFPKLGSTAAGGLYVGYSQLESSYKSCSSTFLTCWATPRSNVEVEDTDLPPSTRSSPTVTQTAESQYASTAATFYLAGSAASSSRTTATRPTSPATVHTSTERICTNPSYTTSDPTGTIGMDKSGYWWVNNDMWAGGPGSQTLHACSQSSWYAVSNQADIGGQVETYPNTEYDVGSRATGTTETISQFSAITSTFSEAFPSGTGGWDAAYDLWLNNWGTEIMIWNEWTGAQSYWPRKATQAVTLGGVRYRFYKNGGELMFFRDSQVKSGSVNVLAALKWLVKHGLVRATDVPTQLEYGVEVCYTSGSETFPLTGLTFSVK